MNYFRGSACSGSAFLGAHLMRALRRALLAWAIVHQTRTLGYPGGALPPSSRYADGPMCWTWACRDAFQGRRDSTDKIVVGVREPAPRCRGWRPRWMRCPICFAVGYDAARPAMRSNRQICDGL